ncbi:MAG: sugar phosphate nucleotidyltransferase [Candidatus Omnitrophota bacterium]
MSNYTNPSKIDVVILCGGEGKRLSSILKDRPKPMAVFGNRPFLSLLMEYVSSFGFSRFILCTGYKGDFIKRYYCAHSLPWEVLYSQEEKPLGTGGAIKKAKNLIRSNPFLVMNGDAFLSLNLGKFINFHLRKKALLSLALVDKCNNRNFGKVILDNRQRIIVFREKTKVEIENFYSAGTYLMDRDIFSFMPRRRVISLEHDFFPKIVLMDKRCYGFKQNFELVDFGTPNGYRRAKQLFSKKRYV